MLGDIRLVFARNQTAFLCAYRKLLQEDQLEAGTKAAQQEEMERRKRLEQQRKDFPAPPPAVPDSQLGNCILSMNCDQYFCLTTFETVSAVTWGPSDQING